MDVRKLEQAESFAAFIEFLTHPEEYKANVEEAKKVLEDWKQTNLVARKIKDVDAWRAQLQKEFDEFEKKIKANEVAVDKRLSEERDRLEETANDLVKQKGQLDKDLKEVAARLKELEYVAQAGVQLNLDQYQLDKRQQDIVTQEKQLKAKQDAVVKAFGG